MFAKSRMHAQATPKGTLRGRRISSVMTSASSTGRALASARRFAGARQCLALSGLTFARRAAVLRAASSC
jgi:hypothetical protein